AIPESTCACLPPATVSRVHDQFITKLYICQGRRGSWVHHSSGRCARLASGAAQRDGRPMVPGCLALSAATLSAFEHFVEGDAAALGAALAGAGVAGDELGAVRPALEVFSGVPAGEDDIRARLLAAAQHLQAAKARHLVHLPGAVLPAQLESRRHLA